MIYETAVVIGAPEQSGRHNFIGVFLPDSLPESDTLIMVLSRSLTPVSQVNFKCHI
jgi:hypothetical protein